MLKTGFVRERERERSTINLIRLVAPTRMTDIGRICCGCKEAQRIRKALVEFVRKCMRANVLMVNYYHV